MGFSFQVNGDENDNLFTFNQDFEYQPPEIQK